MCTSRPSYFADNYELYKIFVYIIRLQGCQYNIMAGRGGRPATSLTQEQLMALGVNSKEMQSVTNAPPPIFPPLFSKPVPLEVQIFFYYFELLTK